MANNVYEAKIDLGDVFYPALPPGYTMCRIQCEALPGHAVEGFATAYSDRHEFPRVFLNTPRLKLMPVHVRLWAIASKGPYSRADEQRCELQSDGKWGPWQYVQERNYMQMRDEVAK